MYDLEDGQWQLNSGASRGYIGTGGTDWHKVEVHFKLSPTAGYIYLRVDDVDIANVVGITTGGGAEIAKGILIQFEHSYGADYCAVDDLALNDITGANNASWCGDGHIIALRPDGAGTKAEWTPSVGANYSCVNESGADVTDYVTGGIAANIDLYEHDDSPAGDYAIIAVSEIAYAAAPVGGVNSVSFMSEEGGTEKEYPSAYPPTDQPWMYYGMLPTNAEDNAWTKALVTSSEYGLKYASTKNM